MVAITLKRAKMGKFPPMTLNGASSCSKHARNLKFGQCTPLLVFLKTNQNFCSHIRYSPGTGRFAVKKDPVFNKENIEKR